MRTLVTEEVEEGTTPPGDSQSEAWTSRLTSRLAGLAPIAVAAVVVVGVALRFFSTSELWLDEALSVNIAALPVGDVFEALRHDGHPPLYYLLLHYWMQVFGEGDMAVRALSGVISVATLPLAWVAGRRLAGVSGARWALVVLALSPYAIRYSTETRMYSLVMLLVLAGYLLVTDALKAPTARRLVAIGLVSGLLLLTHYWSFYLLGAVALLLALRWWRSPGSPAPSESRPRPSPRRRPTGRPPAGSSWRSSPAACCSCPGWAASSTRPVTPAHRGASRSGRSSSSSSRSTTWAAAGRCPRRCSAGRPC
jgi:hypothetical protein